VTIRKQDLLYWAMIIVACFFWFHNCEGKRIAESQYQDIQDYKDTAMFYKARDGQQIAYNKAIVADVRRMADSVQEQIRNLKIKNPVSFTKIITETVLDTIQIRFNTHDTLRLPCDEFERRFTVDSSFYLIDGLLTNESLTFNRISFPDDLSIVVGTKKNGLFKANEYIVTAQHTNPYVVTTGLQNFEFKPDKKWWQRGWVKFVAGIVVGGVTATELNKP